MRTSHPQKEWVFKLDMPKYVEVGHVALSTKRGSRARVTIDFVKAFWKISGYKSVALLSVDLDPNCDRTVYTMVAKRSV